MRNLPCPERYGWGGRLRPTRRRVSRPGRSCQPACAPEGAALSARRKTRASPDVDWGWPRVGAARAGVASAPRSNYTNTEEEAMGHSRARLSAIVALGAAAAVMVTTAASAGQVGREPTNEESAEVSNDFCGVPGMTVGDASVVDGRVQAVAHGRDRLVYFLQQGRVHAVLTNLSNGKSITAVLNVTEKTLRVTDNGDGTLTVVNLSTGNFVLYAEDGKAIARDPGQVRFKYLLDHNGTPADPFDDQLLAELGMVKGPTGRSDDFCAAAVPALR